MRIGIDIDEVIAEFLDSFLEFYNSKYEKNFQKKDFKSYIFEEILGGTHEDAIELIKEHGYKWEIKLVEGALDSIRKLAEKHELIILTARHPMFKNETEDFLKVHFGNVLSEIYYTGEAFQKYGVTKSDICKELNIDILIEDNKIFSLECAEKGIKVLLFDKPWNQDCFEHENVLRAYNWKEILEKIEKMKEMKEINEVKN